MSFTDLPVEIRLKIFSHALPTAISVCQMQAGILGDQHTNFSDILERPRWMFASRQIREETYELFWNRITYNFSDDDRLFSDSCCTPEPGCGVYLPTQVLHLIRHVVFPASSLVAKHNYFSDDWSLPMFPNLKRITLGLHASSLDAPQVQRLYLELRRGLVQEVTGVRTEYSLGLLFGRRVHAIHETLDEFLSVVRRGEAHGGRGHLGALGARANELCRRYDVSFEVPDRVIEQDWLSMPAYGIVNNVHHSAIMHLSYNWNTQTACCTFQNVKETVSRDVEGLDHNVLKNGTPLPGASDGHQYPKLYLSAKQGVARKQRKLSEMLIHQEMLRQGVVPYLDVQRGPKSVCDYYV